MAASLYRETVTSPPAFRDLLHTSKDAVKKARVWGLNRSLKLTVCNCAAQFPCTDKDGRGEAAIERPVLDIQDRAHCDLLCRKVSLPPT